MKRLLTLTTGGLFAAMAILPVAAFADTTAAQGKDARVPAAATTQTETKTLTPPADAKAEAKGHKAEAKSDTMKHDGAKAPVSHSNVQPKPVEPGKS